MARSGVVLGATAASVLLLDQVTKALVRAEVPVGSTAPLVDRVLFLTHARNTGAAFSILQGAPWLFALTAAIMVAIALIWFIRRRPTDLLLVFGLGLLIGGALGNFVDRVTLGYVTDFLDVRIWPVFNVADSGVVVGVAILAFKLGFEDVTGGRAGEGSDAGAGATGDSDAGATDDPNAPEAR